MKKLFYTFTIILFITILCSCNKNESNSLYKETSFLLGTIVEIKTYNENSDLNQKAFERIKEIEKKMTINGDGSSEIEKLNVKGSSVLSDDTFYVLSKGKYYSEISKGRFDITIGSIVKLWNIGTENAHKPDDNLIKQKLSLVDYNKLKLDEQTKTARLLNNGMVIDLGAVAKGYAADEVKRILVEKNIKNAMINIGGNIMTIGTKLDGSSWQIGIQNPFSTRGEYLGILQLNDESVSSSGDYEKYFEQDNIRYHHILDPATGYPCDNELTAVSVIARNSIDADSLSTLSFLMGTKDGIDFINLIDNVEAIFITKDKKVYLTKGLENHKFKLTDKSFKLASYN